MISWIDYRTQRPTAFKRNNIPAVPNRCVVDLSTAESTRLRENALRCEYNPYKRSDQEAFISCVKTRREAIFASSTIEKIRTELDEGYGAVVMTNLPTDDALPRTPLRGGALAVDFKTTFVAEFALILLGSVTDAEPFNFHQEGVGSAPLIDNVVPVPELKSQRGAGGFENNFPFHCESTFHRLRPDYLILLGIRGVSDAKTILFSVQDFDDHQWPLTDLPQQDWFRVRAPDLYVQMQRAGMPLGTPAYSTVPPIYSSEGSLRLNINFNGTECRDEESLDWLTRLEEFIEGKAQGTVLEPGSAIILNNDRTCHTRTGYDPSFSGLDRWFIRGNFKKGLWERQTENRDRLNVFNRSEIRRLFDLGWLNENGDLLQPFEEYIQNPSAITNLGAEEADLIEIAFHFTPRKGVRIV